MSCGTDQPDRVGGVIPLGIPISPSGGGGPHPRNEAVGLPKAIQELLKAYPDRHPEALERVNKPLLPLKRRDKSIGTPSAMNRTIASAMEGVPYRSAEREEQVPTDRLPARRGEHVRIISGQGAWEPRCTPEGQLRRKSVGSGGAGKPSASFGTGEFATKRGVQIVAQAIDQALRAADLLLQGGGFGVIVMDLGGVPAEMAWKIPMATWFRFRAAAERSHVSFVLLTQYPCTRSSAELVVQMRSGEVRSRGNVMSGVTYGADVGRQRFVLEPEKVVSIRKPPQSDRPGEWSGTAAWVRGQRA